MSRASFIRPTWRPRRLSRSEPISGLSRKDFAPVSNCAAHQGASSVRRIGLVMAIVCRRDPGRDLRMASIGAASLGLLSSIASRSRIGSNGTTPTGTPPSEKRSRSSLLEPLDVADGPSGDIAAQRVGAIGVDAEMEVDRRKGERGRIGRQMRDHPLREIVRAMVAAEHHRRATDPALSLILDEMRINASRAADRRGHHRDVGRGAQRIDQRRHDMGGSQRSVALEVDHHVGRDAKPCDCIGATLGAVGARLVGHHHLSAERLHGTGDAVIVSGDPDRRGVGDRRRAFPAALDQRLRRCRRADERRQWLGRITR